MVIDEREREDMDATEIVTLTLSRSPSLAAIQMFFGCLAIAESRGERI